MDQEIIEQLAAFSVPNPLPSASGGRYDQRNWVIRLEQDLPTTWRLDESSALLGQAARLSVARARAERGLPIQDAGPHVPIIGLLPIDARHLVLKVSTIRLKEDDTYAYLVAAVAALMALDKEKRIEDIQGIPRRFWRVLIGE